GGCATAGFGISARGGAAARVSRVGRGEVPAPAGCGAGAVSAGREAATGALTQPDEPWDSGHTCQDAVTAKAAATAPRIHTTHPRRDVWEGGMSTRGVRRWT